MFSWASLPRPIFGVSPMADMTDMPFNLVCKAHGAPVIFKEMVSSEALFRKSEKTIRMTTNDDGERPVIQQIFGSDPVIMAKAAEFIVDRCHPDGIDINMGCPVYKIVSNFDGAALMKDPERAAAIVREIKKAVQVPVSVKTRLGWSNDRDCLDFVRILEDAGAELVTIHGRTKAQGYSGTANWERVGEAKRGVSIPVLVNGDVVSPETAKRALEISGADGVLIGRGVLGHPWIFSEIQAAMNGSEYVPPTLQDRIRIVRMHAELQVKHYGERGLIKLRKHLPYYFKGMAGWKDVRQELVHVSTLAELSGILDRLEKIADVSFNES